MVYWTRRDMQYSQAPSLEWVSRVLWGISGVGITMALASKIARPSSIKQGLRNLTVRAKKIDRAAREIERKTFHLCGLLVPLWYQQMTTTLGFSERFCSQVCIAVTAAVWVSEVARLHIPAVQRMFLKSPMGRIMREREKTQMTGTPYFVLGCTLAISLFPREIAITSILFLVLGDMVAALIGVSFGGETVVVKLGRDHKKSVEGSLAMFLLCFSVCCLVFARVHLVEYVAFVAAAVATITELYSEDLLWGLNDNVTIPFFSCIALTWAFDRTQFCA